MRQRPLGVSLLACCHWCFATVFLLLAGFSGFALVAHASTPTATPVANIVFGVLALALAFILGAAARGLWRLHRSTYSFVLVIHGMAFFGNMMTAYDHGQTFRWTMLISAAIVLYLLRPSIRAVFREGHIPVSCKHG